LRLISEILQYYGKAAHAAAANADEMNDAVPVLLQIRHHDYAPQRSRVF
jgi:hypothetical protein